ncbi:hypothetical protein ABVK25_012412 [Lepraria finkii]|uniref:Uncharacterized protein n=1 Tax=Lepraria finkii TaxID=1340010 RepID=A0ABR4AFD9_9LECA
MRLSTGAKQIRIRVSNAFGETDLHVSKMTVALPFNGASGVNPIIPETLMPVTFSGNTDTVIASAALAVSDPIESPVDALSVISVSMFLSEGQSSVGGSKCDHKPSRQENHKLLYSVIKLQSKL